MYQRESKQELDVTKTSIIHQRTDTSGMNCVVNTTEVFGGVGDSYPERLFDTNVYSNCLDSKVGIDSNCLGLGSRLLSSFEIDISHN